MPLVDPAILTGTFAPAETVVAAWLRAQFTACRVVTELPASLSTVVATTPVIQVSRFGGSSSLLGLDAANLDVDTFDLEHDGKSARENSLALGESVRAALFYLLPGSTQDGARFGEVSEINGPRWVPYDNTELRRHVASYRITIRSEPTEGVLP